MYFICNPSDRPCAQAISYIYILLIILLFVQHYSMAAGRRDESRRVDRLTLPLVLSGMLDNIPPDSIVLFVPCIA